MSERISYILADLPVLGHAPGISMEREVQDLAELSQVRMIGLHLFSRPICQKNLFHIR